MGWIGEDITVVPNDRLRKRGHLQLPDDLGGFSPSISRSSSAPCLLSSCRPSSPSCPLHLHAGLPFACAALPRRPRMNCPIPTTTRDRRHPQRLAHPRHDCRTTTVRLTLTMPLHEAPRRACLVVIMLRSSLQALTDLASSRRLQHAQPSTTLQLGALEPREPDEDKAPGPKRTRQRAGRYNTYARASDSCGHSGCAPLDGQSGV
ncbi:hypothetical protein PENSPDRAFT_229166 [Peniophora sp. CONT]|nr:hypothetical protein PENSPDRAFT_229166 [Peniophora sp. CONT]